MTAQTSTYTPSTVVSTDNAPVLRRALYANAAFSLISGLLFALMPARIAAFMGIAETRIFNVLSGAGFIQELGIGVMVFAAVVGFIATRRPITKAAGIAIFIADCVWIAASIALIVTRALPLSTAGFWMVLVIGDIVTALAVWEFIGVRRMTAG
jgi:hypothetical protein